VSDDDLKKQLEEIKNQIIQVRIDIADGKLRIEKMRKYDLNERIFDSHYSWLKYTHSDYGLYFSIFLSAVIGVLGNWYVNLLFQPPSETVNSLLVLGSIPLVGALFYLGIRMFLINREFKKQLKKVDEAMKQWRVDTEKDKIEADTV